MNIHYLRSIIRNSAFGMTSYKLSAAGCHFGAHGMSALSNYAEKLPSEAKQRYQNKPLLIGGFDPFCISGKSYRESNFLLSNLFVCESNFPPVDPFCISGKSYCESKFLPVDASDLVSYLVLQTSPSVHAVLLSVWGIHIHNNVILQMISLLYGNLHGASCFVMSNPSSLQLYIVRKTF